MAPPSKLGVSTSALQRLVKEEASYHKELEQQQSRITKLEAAPDEENAEYMLKQERQAIEETKKVLPTVREKITRALEQLEEQLESNKDAGGEASAEDVTKAKNAVAAAKTTLRESA
ncbi:putative tubulin-specific chaperone Rbl2 [Massarina eburnea CBS 473.64]|uniref:Tubulin-specific chaperone A n=1 Tax=Massarina eburnea CBS 473.64 TaxID=1395130 RepID=A0A6A6RYH4_9PLEO|nr:putative tubulin-specific chaperone Rbl2 [Massarina eburnea CBS 473.64]